MKYKRVLAEENKQLREELREAKGSIRYLKEQCEAYEKLLKNPPDGCTPGGWCMACENGYTNTFLTTSGLPLPAPACRLSKCERFIPKEDKK